MSDEGALEIFASAGRLRWDGSVLATERTASGSVTTQPPGRAAQTALRSATGRGAQPVWRIQGMQGGEHPANAVRGPFNNGGLYGERVGWSLPGDADRGWLPVSLPSSGGAPSVTCYRSRFRLALPRNQDTSLGLEITDEPGRHPNAIWLPDRKNCSRFHLQRQC